VVRIKILAGNWKMYKTPREAVEYVKVLRERLKDVKDREIVVCPPAVALAGVADVLRGSNIQVGAQDAHYENEGAFTGNLSPVMLKEVGAQYVILGHSERRQYEKETDETINKKAKNVLKSGLKPIVWPASPNRTSNVSSSHTNPCGPSAPARRPPRSRPTRCTRPSAS
jgi:triosephosphate isomerase